MISTFRSSLSESLELDDEQKLDDACEMAVIKLEHEDVLGLADELELNNELPRGSAIENHCVAPCLSLKGPSLPCHA